MATLKDIVESTAALNELAGMPQRPVVAFRIAKAIKFVSGEVTDFDEARKKLLDQFGDKDADGKLVVVNGSIQLGGREAEFAAAFKTLLDEEVSLPPSVKLVKMSEFDNPLKPALLLPLFWLIDDSDQK
jgi:hypothetical protein